MSEPGHRNEGGKSSFAWVDTNKLFQTLNLKPGITFLDLGCGKGEYSLAAAEQIGDTGTVIGVDQWPDGIKQLQEAARDWELATIQTYCCDISQGIPVKDRTVDLCFIASILHGFVKNGILPGVMKEAKRVLKPEGDLAIVEWKKLEGAFVEGTFGPPMDIRLSEAEVENLMGQYGFSLKDRVEVGEYFYLVIFKVKNLKK